jgi:hypothetical protein
MKSSIEAGVGLLLPLIYSEMIEVARLKFPERSWFYLFLEVLVSKSLLPASGWLIRPIVETDYR